MKKLKNIINSNRFIYILIFISFIILCFLFPYSQDDWDWGTKYGIERLENYFDNYNGRWAGNLIVLALTRSNILKTIVMASCLTAIIYFINNIIKSDKKSTILLSYLLLLSTPHLVLRQAIVWTSGFSNYTTSIFFILLFIKLNKNLFDNETLKTSNKHIPLFLLLGFITTLFMENITIYIICLSIFILVYSYKKTKKIYGIHIGYLIGVIGGSILMFSNSAYRSIAQGNDFYRTIETNIIGSSINNFFNIIYKELIFNNHILNIILSVLVINVLYKVLKNNKIEKSLKKLANIILYIVISFVLYSCITRLLNIQLLLKYTKYFNGIFTIIYYVSLIMFVVFFINKNEVKRRMLFILMSIFIMTLPLFIVTPIGGRCFLPTYILFILFAVDLLNYCLNNKIIQEIETNINKTIKFACYICYVYLICIYGNIYITNVVRLKYIKQNIDNQEIIIPKLPYPQYTWYGDPSLQIFKDRFKTYHGIPENTNIIYVSIEEWKKIR